METVIHSSPPLDTVSYLSSQEPTSNMLAKIVVLAFVVTVVSAFVPFPPIAPVADVKLGGPFLPHPYSFGYSIKHVDGEQHRQETGDGKGLVQGSYGFVDARGIKRQVHYIADHLGFRAKVITNEPGTANQHPAAVIMESSQG